MAFNPYKRALAGLAHGDVVVCVPIRCDGELSWAVASYLPYFFDEDDPMDLLAIHLIADARGHLQAAGVDVL